jgi:hypothetical protein
MAQQSLADIFEDCINRIRAGQAIEACLQLYPEHALRLRPLLETAEILREMRVPQTELLEDRALVWQQIQRGIPLQLPRRGRVNPIGLLAAIFLLLLLLAATWFVLTRPDLPPDDTNNIISPLTETELPTLSELPSATHTPSATETLTPTPMATTIQLPTATFAPGCGAPLTEQDARDRVLEIYPNTTITSVTQQVKFGGTLVWEVHTSHGVVVTIDVACGNILTIERGEDDNGNQNANDNSADGNTNDNINDQENSNTNPPDDDNDNGGDNENGNDNSGSGDSGMGSGD